MSKIPKEDSFSIINGIARDRLDSSISLNNSHFKSIKIPNHFKKDVYTGIPESKKLYRSKIGQISTYLKNKSIQYGYNNSIETPIFEAILNAHQHGNKLNPSNNIIVASHINSESLELIICDNGTELPKSFLAYVLNQRNNNQEDKKIFNWYDFSNQNKLNQDNLGTGTSFMHAYMDEVKYFKSRETNGLAVYMKKFNK